MNRTFRTALAFLVCTSFTSLVSAQATRTWVSGVGDDANPCSRTAPCKTFAGAISKTASHGEINVLDPGGFGGVTITKSITIDGGGMMAGVLVSGTNAILINDSANAGIVVTLRNLNFTGLTTGLIAIRVMKANAVVIENVKIRGFQTGISAEWGNTMVTNSSIVQNSQFGARLNPSLVTPPPTPPSLTLVGNMLMGNGTALQADGAGATLRIIDNSIFNNGIGFGCGTGILASAGNNTRGNNPVSPNCAPTVAVTVQ